MQKKLLLTIGTEKMFLGVCGGLAKYFNVDPTLIRLAVAIITFFSFFSLAIVYVLAGLIIPKESTLS